MLLRFGLRPDHERKKTQMMDDAVPKVHDGNRVRKFVEKSGITFEDFESKIGWNSGKRYRMFKLDSWKASDLSHAGKVLEFDFLSVYRVFQESQQRKTTTILVPVTVVIPHDLEVRNLDDLESMFRVSGEPPDH
jgi:hypothetical protein